MTRHREKKSTGTVLGLRIPLMNSALIVAVQHHDQVHACLRPKHKNIKRKVQNTTKEGKRKFKLHPTKQGRRIYKDGIEIFNRARMSLIYLNISKYIYFYVFQKCIEIAEYFGFK